MKVLAPPQALWKYRLSIPGWCNPARRPLRATNQWRTELQATRHDTTLEFAAPPQTAHCHKAGSGQPRLAKRWVSTAQSLLPDGRLGLG